MDAIRPLLATDERQTLQFFFAGLRGVTADERVDALGLLYNASVLAHFASTSTATVEGWPSPHALEDIFDRYVLHDELAQDTEAMELAAGQCLLLSGFFAEQSRRRHDLEWYGHLGSTFFDRAAMTTLPGARRRMMVRMAIEFEDWRRRYFALARQLRRERYRLIA
jgi:hypothetical protein